MIDSAKAQGQPKRYSRRELCEFAQNIFGRLSVPPKAGAIAADLLVSADEREVSTHGLVRLSPYVRRLQEGLVNADPSLEKLTEWPGFTLIDGDDGLGQVTASAATDEAIRQAGDVGFAAVGVKNSHHLGMCAPYAERIAQSQFIGIVMTNTASLMAPTGSAKRLIGNNPVSIAVPRSAPHRPIVLDVAFSHTAFGTLQRMAIAGETVPDGWVHDEQGKWINDPATAIQSGIMAPIGAHKGYGLALIVEILTGALTDSNVLDNVGSLFRLPPSHMRVGHLVIAIDPGMLIEREVFLRRVEDICTSIAAAPPLPGVEKVRLPGDPEYEARQRSQSLGIPLSDNVRDQLSDLGAEFGVALPNPISSQEVA